MKSLEWAYSNVTAVLIRQCKFGQTYIHAQEEDGEDSHLIMEAETEFLLL